MNARLNENEINFLELLSIIWAYKFIIIFIVIISTFLSGIFALNADKMYTANAIFKLRSLDSQKPGFSIPGQLGAFSGLMGGDFSQTSDMASLLERINGRIFIENLNKKIDFKSDRFYNTYNPDGIDPLWKATLKRLLNYSNNDYDKDEIIWRSILNKYRKFIKIKISDAGSLAIEVQHSSPERASEISNIIMLEIISDQENKIQTEQNERLSYLSSSLASSLYDLEQSQTNLKDFAIENTSKPIRSFEAASLKLEISKEIFLETQELYLAVNEIGKIYKKNKISHLAYLSLKKNHPIIDDVKFRRIFGQNEIVSEWTWPKPEMVGAVLKTLNDRKIRLNNEVEDAKEIAKKLATSVKKFSDLKRENSIAEATHTVMIEQVKSNSMLNGYNSSNSKSEIYQYAVTPISPSSPNRNLIIVMGTLLGALVGITIAFMINIWRDVYYSNKSLLAACKINYSFKTNSLRKLSKKSFEQLSKRYNLSPLPVLRDLVLEIKQSKRKIIIISCIGSKLNANSLAKLLAFNLQADGSNVAYLDFSKITKPTNNNDLDLDPKHNFNIVEKYEKLNILTPIKTENSIDFLTNNGADKILKDLTSDYDYLILSAEYKNSFSLARFVRTMNVYHIALSRKNKTKRKFLQEIFSILPIEAHLYD